MTKLDKLIDSAYRALREQRKWMVFCGDNRAGYIIRYGSRYDPIHSGDGGEAIYAADHGELKRCEDNLMALVARARKPLEAIQKKRGN
jgi:hypothetical protein